MSRELDAWLAEHLFGVAHEHDVYPARCHCSDGLHDWTEENAVCPAYSSTGNGMLQVIEALRSRGLMVEVGPWSGTSEWLATILPFDEKDDRGTFDFAPTMPEAVALAAKAALEAQA